MSTIIENCEDLSNGYDKRIHMKGASEIVLENCSYYLNAKGERKALSEEMKQQIHSVITGYAESTLRTIGFAYKDITPN